MVTNAPIYGLLSFEVQGRVATRLHCLLQRTGAGFVRTGTAETTYRTGSPANHATRYGTGGRSSSATGNRCPGCEPDRFGPDASSRFQGESARACAAGSGGKAA